MTASVKASALVAALFLAVTAAVKLATPQYIDADMARRVVGVMMGCLVVFYANAVPKHLAPLATLRCDPATEQAIRRFSAMSLVFGGLAYALVWIVTPIESANLVGAGILAVCVLLAALRYSSVFIHRSQD